MNSARKRLYLFLKGNRRTVVDEWVDGTLGPGRIRRSAKDQYRKTAEKLYPLILAHILDKNDRRCEKVLNELVFRGYLRDFPYERMVRSMITFRRILIKLANSEFREKELLDVHTIIGEEYDYCNHIISGAYIRERESQLRESEDKYRKLVGSVNDIIYVLDGGGRFNFINKTAEKLSGYSVDELLKMRFTDVLAPESKRITVENFKKRLRGLKIPPYEIKVLKKYGGELTLEISAVPLRRDGKIAGEMGVARDVTERKRVEDTLRAEEERYRVLFENANDAVFIADTKTGKLMYANRKAEELTGRSRKELIGMHQSKLHPPKEREHYKRFFRSHAMRGATDAEAVVRSKDGRDIPVLVSASVFEMEGRRVMQGIFRDITGRKRSEDALRESESRWRSLVHNIPDIIITADRHGKILSINHTIRGLKAREVLGKRLGDYEAPEFRKVRKKSVERVFRTGKPDVYEILGTGPDEPMSAWYETRVVPVKRNKRVVAVTLIIRDITDRKRFEEELQKSEAKYRAVVEDQTELICRSLPGGTLTFVNDAYCRYFGRKRDELIGRSFMPLIPVEDRERVGDSIASISPKKPLATIEHRVIRPNGEIRWQQWTDRAILDRKGRIAEIQSIGRDITDKKRADENVLSIKNHLETVINGIEESIVVIDRKYRIITHNEAFARSLRHPTRNIRGKKCHEVIHGYKNPCRSCVVKNMFRTGRPCEDLHSHVEDGKRVWHEVKAYPLKSPNGGINQAVYVFRDFTKRAEMEEDLRENYKRLEEAHERLKDLDKMKSEFVSMTSHELQTPLSIIKGYSEVLEDGSLGRLNESQQEKLGIMKRNIDHLIDLVSSILDLSRIESGDMEFGFERLDLRKPVNKVLGDMAPIAGKKSITVVRRIPKEIPRVRADGTRIEQVIRNLLENAIKFTPDGGRITVTLTAGKNEVHLSVRDTGIGVPDDELERVFDSFYQVDTSATRRFKGVGLGLTICRRIVEAHGGKIDIDSKLGEGTTVNVSLPRQ